MDDLTEKAYRELYIKRKKYGLTPVEEADFDDIERDSTYESLWSTRLSAHAQMSKEQEEVSRTISCNIILTLQNDQIARGSSFYRQASSYLSSWVWTPRQSQVSTH